MNLQYEHRDYGRVASCIRNVLRTYAAESRLKALVVGLSGGIDSAVTAALAAQVCKDLRIPLIGQSIPILTNKQEELDRAKMIGVSFCDEFAEKDRSAIFDAVASEYIPEYASLQEMPIGMKIRLGNIKARLRMIELFDLAQKYGGMVLSTDNLTELYLGFWTLHGDVGNYGLIQNMWKDEVYTLATFLAVEAMNEGNRTGSDGLVESSEAEPTDGLGVSESDLEQLGADTYTEATNIVKAWLCQDQDSYYYDDVFMYEERPEPFKEFWKYRQTLADHPIVTRHLTSMFKRNDPYNIPRHMIFGGKV